MKWLLSQVVLYYLLCINLSDEKGKAELVEIEKSSVKALFAKYLGSEYEIKMIYSVANFDQLVTVKESGANKEYSYSVKARPLRDDDLNKKKQLIGYQEYMHVFGFPLMRLAMNNVTYAHTVNFNGNSYMAFTHHFDTHFTVSIWDKKSKSYIGSYSGGMGMTIGIPKGVSTDHLSVKARPQIIGDIFKAVSLNITEAELNAQEKATKE